MMKIKLLHVAFLSTMIFQNLSAQTYCASKGNHPWNEWIAKVQFGTIQNASVKEGYGNFVSQATVVNRGSSYPLTLTRGFSWAGDPTLATQQGRVWIDFNQNGTFEATELAASFARAATTATITIPTTALLGNTRMRISLKTIGVPTACEIFERGEVEDYTVNVGGVSTGNLPDLTMANLNLTQSSVSQGQVLNYKFDLKNIGTGNAPGRFNVKGYISKDNVLSSDDIQDGIVPTANFAAGFSVLQVPGASTIPANLAAGQYYLILKADADFQVAESNENNNVLASLPFRVTASGGNNCYNYFDLKSYEPTFCNRTPQVERSEWGYLQQYGQNITTGFHLFISDFIGEAHLYARNGVSTPPAGTKFRNCAGNWVYFTAEGGSRKIAFGGRARTEAQPRVYIRVKTVGNPLNIDSLHVEVDSITMSALPVPIHGRVLASTTKKQTCNPCFATDRTLPVNGNCPANTVIFPLANPMNRIETYQIFQTFGGITPSDNCPTGLQSFRIPEELFSVNWNQVYDAQQLTYDAAGNKSVCNVKIRMSNPPCSLFTTPPVFANCPANKAVTAAAGQTCAAVTWVAPTVAGNQTIPVKVTSNFASGHCFPIGTTNVIYTATDSCGNVGKCNFNVTVRGNTTTCLNRFELGGFSTIECARKQPTLSYNFGALQQYGQNIAYGFTVQFGDPLNRANLFARNGVTTPQVGSKFRNCPANWIYFTATGGNKRNDAHTTMIEYSKVYMRVRAFGNALNPDSLYIELDSTTIQDHNFIPRVWATIRKTQNCNPCFARDTVPPTVSRCPTTPTVIFPTKYPSDLIGGGTIINQLGLQFDDNCSVSDEFKYPIPNFMSANWNAIQPFEVIQYDSAGHKTVCSTRLKFVPDCANTPVTPIFNSCPTNLTVSVAAGQTCGVAKWAQPTLEMYMKTALSSNFASGHCFPLGTTTVIYTAKDSCNHTATCSFTVTVKHAVAIAGQANAVVTPLNARVYDNKVKLDWVQLSSDAATFEVQKPTEDGSNFKTIHQIVAQPTDGYHSGYDELPEEGANDYRLKTVLKDGKEIYSPIERVDYQKLPDFTVFPNPTQEETFVDLKNFVNQKVELSISDLAGKVLLKQIIEHASILPHRVDVSKLQNGAYLLEIQTVGKRTVTRQMHILK